MDLSKYDGKHVRITDKWGETFTGMAEYGNYNFLECEYGGEEDGVFVAFPFIQCIRLNICCRRNLFDAAAWKLNGG